jgi:aspartate/methionine/tyrosine aminotransferase
MNTAAASSARTDPARMQVLALMALRARGAILARNLATIRAGIAAARQLVADFPHLLEWQEPQAGSVAFPRFKGGGPGVEAWCERVVSEAGILLLPATVYDHQASISRGHFRLGLGRRDCVEKLALLRAYLEKGGGGWEVGGSGGAAAGKGELDQW